MKKILSLIFIALLFAATLSSCGGRKDKCPGVGQVEVPVEKV